MLESVPRPASEACSAMSSSPMPGHLIHLKSLPGIEYLGSLCVSAAASFLLSRPNTVCFLPRLRFLSLSVPFFSCRRQHEMMSESQTAFAHELSFCHYQLLATRLLLPRPLHRMQQITSELAAADIQEISRQHCKEPPHRAGTSNFTDPDGHAVSTACLQPYWKRH